MDIDTEKTIYVCTDRDNDEVRVLIPHNLKSQLNLVHLNLSDRDPDCTDAAEFKLLLPEMDETRLDV